MEHENPPFDQTNLPVHRDYSTPNSAPPPSAATEEIVRELDIRFPPNATIGEADREAQILLLASDVADINPLHLRAATAEWVRTKAFMPKASELRALAAAISQRKSNNASERGSIGHRVADSYNTRLAYETPDKGIRWIYDERSDQMRLVPLAEYRRITA